MASGSIPHKNKTQTLASGSRFAIKKLSIKRISKSVGSPGPAIRLSATRNFKDPTTRLSPLKQARRQLSFLLV